MFGIDSVADLQQKELSLVAYLTEEWFRILESPKVRGHENHQAVHPVWQEVQELFRACFSGAECEQQDIERRRCNVLKCTGEALVKQALGCISTVATLNKGMDCTIDNIIELTMSKLKSYGLKVTQRAKLRAVELGIVRGVSPVDFEPRKALTVAENNMPDLDMPPQNAFDTVPNDPAAFRRFDHCQQPSPFFDDWPH